MVRTKIRILALVSLVFVPIVTGCDSSSGSEAIPDSKQSASPVASVLVEKSNIAPTVSARESVSQDPIFVITLPERGAFKAVAKVDDAVKKGDLIAWANGNEIHSPVDATVVNVAEASDDLPANFVVVSLKYRGFGIESPARQHMQGVDIKDMSGKFQVIEGVGPTNCDAILPGASPLSSQNQVAQDQNGDGSEDSLQKDQPTQSLENVVCIIGKEVNVQAGQLANLVITGNLREGVLVLPVAAVAGRIDEGRVILLEGEQPKEVNVRLGVTDGARIEILSGIKEGDKVLLSSPDLDPRMR